VRCIRLHTTDARACAGPDCGAAAAYVWDREAWAALYDNATREVLPASGWLCADACAALPTPEGYSMHQCALVHAPACACAGDEACEDGVCACVTGFYSDAQRTCTESALELEFAVQGALPGPGYLLPAAARARVGVPALRALQGAGIVRADVDAERASARVFAAHYFGGAIWTCRLALAFHDVHAQELLANHSGLARVEDALFSLNSAHVSLVELGASADAAEASASTGFLRLRALEGGSVRNAASYGFRVLSREVNGTRWLLRLQLADAPGASFALVLARRNASAACAPPATASVQAPCCVGALAQHYLVVQALARASAGCLGNATRIDTLARRDFVSGAFDGCNRSRAWQPAPGLVDVELHADELEGTALQVEHRGGVQSTFFDVGVAVVRPTAPGAFSTRVVLQTVSVQFDAVLTFTSTLDAGQAFTPVADVGLERVYFAAGLGGAAARRYDFVRLAVRARAALGEPANYSVVPESVRVGAGAARTHACVGWQGDEYAAGALAAAGAGVCTPRAAASVCTAPRAPAPATEFVAPLPSSVLDAALANDADASAGRASNFSASVYVDFLVLVRTPTASFVGRIALYTRARWRALAVPCPAPREFVQQPLGARVALGLHPGLSPENGTRAFTRASDVAPVLTLVLEPDATAFTRPGAEDLGLALHDLAVLTLTSAAKERALGRLLAAGRAWDPGTLDAAPALRRLCPLVLDNASALGAAPEFGCHLRYAAYRGLLSTAADYALELTGTEEAPGLGLRDSHGAALAAHAAYAHANLSANARFRRAYLVSARSPDAAPDALNVSVPARDAVRPHRVLLFASAAVRGLAAPAHGPGAFSVRVPALVPVRSPGFAEYVYLQRVYAGAYERVLGLVPGAGLVREFRACAPDGRAVLCFELLLRLPLPRSELGRHHAQALTRALADARSRTHARVRAVLNSSLASFFAEPVWLDAERARLPAPALLEASLPLVASNESSTQLSLNASLRMLDVNAADQAVYYQAARAELGGTNVSAGERFRGRTCTFSIAVPVAEACLAPAEQRAAVLRRLETPLRRAALGTLAEVLVTTLVLDADTDALCGTADSPARRRLLQAPETVRGDSETTATPQPNVTEVIIYGTQDLAAAGARGLVVESTGNLRAARVIAGPGWDLNGRLGLYVPPQPTPPPEHPEMPVFEGLNDALGATVFALLMLYLCCACVVLPACRPRRCVCAGPSAGVVYAHIPHPPREGYAWL
jgi:hypothetical protein